MNTIIGRALPVGHYLTAEPAAYYRGSRERAERIRTLGVQELAHFKLAAVFDDGDCFWWTSQMRKSPTFPSEGRVLFTFVPVRLEIELKLKGWNLVDDEGYLVRVRREDGIWPVGHLIDAVYWLAFDGSDKRR